MRFHQCLYYASPVYMYVCESMHTPLLTGKYTQLKYFHMYAKKEAWVVRGREREGRTDGVYSMIAGFTMACWAYLHVIVYNHMDMWFVHWMSQCMYMVQCMYMYMYMLYMCSCTISDLPWSSLACEVLWSSIWHTSVSLVCPRLRSPLILFSYSYRQVEFSG